MVSVVQATDSMKEPMQRLCGAMALASSSACADVMRLIRERPRLMLGLLTAPLGAVGTAWLATRFPRHRTMRQRLRHSRRQLKGALGLPSVAVKLLGNPLVRDYLHRTVLRDVSRRLGR